MLIWLGKQYLGQSDKLIAEEPYDDESFTDLLNQMSTVLEEATARQQACNALAQALD